MEKRRIRNYLLAIVLALGITVVELNVSSPTATLAKPSYNDPWIIDYRCSAFYIGPYNYAWQAYGLVGYTGAWVLKKSGSGSSYSIAISNCNLWVAIYG